MFLRKRTYKSKAGYWLYGRNGEGDKWITPDNPEETTYYQFCESYRNEEGKPRQRVICSIDGGTSLHALIAYYEKRQPDSPKLQKLRYVQEKFGDWLPDNYDAEAENKKEMDFLKWVEAMDKLAERHTGR